MAVCVVWLVCKVVLKDSEPCWWNIQVDGNKLYIEVDQGSAHHSISFPLIQWGLWGDVRGNMPLVVTLPRMVLTTRCNCQLFLPRPTSSSFKTLAVGHYIFGCYSLVVSLQIFIFNRHVPIPFTSKISLTYSVFELLAFYYFEKSWKL